MTQKTFTPKAYLKEGCPYSFKFMLFMTEAQLANRIEFIRCTPDTPDFESLKKKLSAALGKSASFPTVEIEPGRYVADSDQLISHFASRYGVDAGKLPALAFYRDTIFPQLKELHEIKES